MLVSVHTGLLSGLRRHIGLNWRRHIENWPLLDSDWSKTVLSEPIRWPHFNLGSSPNQLKPMVSRSWWATLCSLCRWSTTTATAATASCRPPAPHSRRSTWSGSAWRETWRIGSTRPEQNYRTEAFLDGIGTLIGEGEDVKKIHYHFHP